MVSGSVVLPKGTHTVRPDAAVSAAGPVAALAATGGLPWAGSRRRLLLGG